MNHSFIFSIVMAVYNADAYLREAISSIQRQTIGFENVQVILIDDGSTDRSGRICDDFAKRFPQNVKAIHQENGGQSIARNRGIELAEGKYINYMDSDDRITPETLEKVAAFFAKHEQETDIVTIPVRYFEAEAGEHWQNAFFEKGNRVIDLQTEFNFLQASVSYAFFMRERVRGIRFQEGLSFAEDTRYVMTCLARLQTIGLVGGCYYEYRRRSAGNSSTQKLTENPLWKTQWMRQYEFWIIDFFRNRFGQIPRWVQYELLCHLGNRMKVDQKAGFTSEEKWYTEQIREICSEIEPEVFRVTMEVDGGIRLLLKSFFLPDRNPRLLQKEDGWHLLLGNEDVGTIGSWPIRLNQVKVKENVTELEGIMYLYAGIKEKDFQLEWQTTEKCGPTCLIRNEEQDLTWNGYTIYWAYRFTCFVPMRHEEVQDIYFRMRCGSDDKFINGGIALGDHIPVLPIPGSTGWTNGWKYIVFATGIHLIPCRTLIARMKREFVWDMMLLKRKQFGAIHQRLGYFAMKMVGRTPRWIREAQGKTMDQLSFEMRYNADLLFL